MAGILQRPGVDQPGLARRGESQQGHACNSPGAPIRKTALVSVSTQSRKSQTRYQLAMHGLSRQGRELVLCACDVDGSGFPDDGCGYHTARYVCLQHRSRYMHTAPQSPRHLQPIGFQRTAGSPERSRRISKRQNGVDCLLLAGRVHV